MVGIVERVREYTKVVLSLKAGWKGRGSTVFPDDIFLVSYPRSGNTWSRFLLTNLTFADDPTTFLNVEARMPEIYAASDWNLRGLPRPRYLKSHECFEPRYKRVIYVVRDPRDVAVSLYYFEIKRREIPDGYPVAAFVEEWMAANWHSEYGTWWEHVQSWLALRRGAPGFLLVRYEDLQARPHAELARIAEFLGLQRSSEQISRVIELSSADRMRALEKAQHTKWAGTKLTRHDKPFVRKATVGDWRAVLPRESVESMESAWGPLMEQLGYPIGAQAQNHASQKPAGNAMESSTPATGYR